LPQENVASRLVSRPVPQGQTGNNRFGCATKGRGQYNAAVLMRGHDGPGGRTQNIDQPNASTTVSPVAHSGSTLVTSADRTNVSLMAMRKNISLPIKARPVAGLSSTRQRETTTQSAPDPLKLT